MALASELVRRGGTLMKEACPKCGSLQLRYKNRTFCLSCDELKDTAEVEARTAGDVTASLRDLVHSKLQESMSMLEREADVDRQTKLATLVLRYLEVLEKVSGNAGDNRSASGETAKTG